MTTQAAAASTPVTPSTPAAPATSTDGGTASTSTEASTSTPNPPATGTTAGGTEGSTQAPANPTPTPEGTAAPEQVTQLQEQVTTLTKERDTAIAARDAALKEKETLQAQFEELKGLAATSLEADLALLSDEQREELKAFAGDPMGQRRQIDFLRRMGLLKAREPEPTGRVFEGISGSGEAGKPGAPKSVAEAARRVKEERRKKK